jgi:hypothetical protein
MKEHKQAYILRAIADGKEVEWQSFATGEWQSIAHGATINPVTDHHIKWRVKPEPKPDYYTYIMSDRSDDRRPIQSENHEFEWKLKIKVTWDGETNEAKSVELIK